MEPELMPGSDCPGLEYQGANLEQWHIRSSHTYFESLPQQLAYLIRNVSKTLKM